MKKIFFAFVAFVFGIAQANAQSITFENVSLPEKGQAELVVNYSTGGKTIVSYGFTIKLPEGLSFVMTDGEPNITYEGGKGVNLTYKDGNFGFLPKNDEVQITGDGVLLKLTLQAGENLKQNDEFEVEVTSLGMTDSDLKDVPIANTTFTVKIVENRLVLDENAEEAPAAAENVNVKVLRTIKANNWSTICLPFAMTEDQVVKAFGDSVQVAEFTACKWDEETKNMSLTFTSKAQKSIEANHPLLIKVTTAITHDNGFNVDNVTIAPDDAEVSILDADENEALFIGTYEPIAKLGKSSRPALFIANNQFYFSKGTASLKPYRAYFEIDDLKDFIANAKIGFLVDDEATAIDGIGMQRIVEGVYDLSGRKIQLEGNDLNKLQKGVYIIDGKKVTIK